MDGLTSNVASYSTCIHNVEFYLGGRGDKCPKKIGELSTLPLFNLMGSIKNDLSVCDGFHFHLNNLY